MRSSYPWYQRAAPSTALARTLKTPVFVCACARVCTCVCVCVPRNDELRNERASGVFVIANLSVRCRKRGTTTHVLPTSAVPDAHTSTALGLAIKAAASLSDRSSDEPAMPWKRTCMKACTGSAVASVTRKSHCRRQRETPALHSRHHEASLGTYAIPQVTEVEVANAHRCVSRSRGSHRRARGLAATSSSICATCASVSAEQVSFIRMMALGRLSRATGSPPLTQHRPSIGVYTRRYMFEGCR